MKTPLFLVLLLVSHSASSALLGKERGWQFIQSVGGITLGEPRHADNHWVLPVNCNVAGLKTYSTKPTAMNSGLACVSTSAHTEGHTIYLAIHTALTGMSGKSSDCGPANLGKLKPGKYKVVYKSGKASTIFIGEVNIGP